MERLPGREISAGEKLIVQQEKERKERELANRKIRCPNCKKNQYFDNYLANPKLGTLVCPSCGVLFIDQAKLRVIKQNVTRAKQQGILVEK